MGREFFNQMQSTQDRLYATIIKMKQEEADMIRQRYDQLERSNRRASRRSRKRDRRRRKDDDDDDDGEGGDASSSSSSSDSDSDPEAGSSKRPRKRRLSSRDLKKLNKQTRKLIKEAVLQVKGEEDYVDQAHQDQYQHQLALSQRPLMRAAPQGQPMERPHASQMPRFLPQPPGRRAPMPARAGSSLVDLANQGRIPPGGNPGDGATGGRA